MKRILGPWRLCEHLVFMRDLDMNPVQLLPSYESNSRKWSSLILIPHEQRRQSSKDCLVLLVVGGLTCARQVLYR